MCKITVDKSRNVWYTLGTVKEMRYTKMAKVLNYKQFMEFALAHYNEGGDGCYECWDELSFRVYVEEFGPMTEKKALKIFREYNSIVKEYQATAW